MALFNFKPKKKKTVLKKNMNWTQAKTKYPKLSPFGDADRDGVKNWLDCKPFDRKRQDDKQDKNESKKADEAWKKLTPKQKALAEEGYLDWDY